jgi:glycosyltransferase involved in cell wall biosynthesis
MFYACYNIRLFCYLLFVKADIFLANDLDTLPANYHASKIRKKKLVYDSHEYFTEVPELIGRNRTRNFWLKIERKILPKIKNSYTVSQSIADEYNKKYRINMQVIMNLPEYKNQDAAIEKKSDQEKIIIYQGALNKARGLEQIIAAMKHINNAQLRIYGDGDITAELQRLVKESYLEEKVIFFGRFPFEKMHEITMTADLGISLEQNMGLNYFYALPNKLFDYIQAQIPVLCSGFPEMKKIIDHYNIGKTIDKHDPVFIAETINKIFADNAQFILWKENLKPAARELCWETQEEKLLKIFSD